MNDEITSSADDQRLSVGPRIEIADDDQQSGVDRSTDGDSVTGQRPATVSHLHVPVGFKGHLSVVIAFILV